MPDTGLSGRFGSWCPKGWRRQWHPTLVLLPGKSHGRRSLVGCSPWGRYESDTTEWLHFHFSLSCIGEGNGNPLQYSRLENPRDGGAWWAAVSGVAQSRTRLKRLSSSSSNGTHSQLIIDNWYSNNNSQLMVLMLAPWKKTYDQPRQHIKKKNRDVTLPTEVHLVKAMVFPVVIYGFESWTIKKAECWRIDAFELWCWRSLLRDPWIARRSNQSILKEISPEYSLEGLILKLKLQYFGHLMRRTDLLEKTLMLEEIEGRRRRGRKRMKWLDGITD